MIRRMSNIENLCLSLFDIDAVRFGRFELASGKISPLYIDLRLMISHPPTLKLAAQAYAEKLKDLNYDVLAAIPYAGLPIGVAISLEINQPLIFPRKDVKSYGTGKSIEGKFEVGQTAVIIEDLITSGGSVLKGTAVLKAAGLQITDAVVLIDRQQGGADNLRKAGFEPHAVVGLDEMFFILEKHGRISAEQHQRVLSDLHGKQ